MLQLTIKTNDAAVEAVLKTLEGLGINDWGLEIDVLETAIKWLRATHQAYWDSAAPNDQRGSEVVLQFSDVLSSLSSQPQTSE